MPTFVVDLEVTVGDPVTGVYMPLITRYPPLAHHTKEIFYTKRSPAHGESDFSLWLGR